MLTPERRRGVEILDDPAVDPSIRARSMQDVARSNRLFGGLRAPVIELRAVTAALAEHATLLDVGTGTADIAEHVRATARAAGAPLRTIGVDAAPSLLAAAQARVDDAVCASALALPFRDHSVDVVLCSQLIHHFDFADAARVLTELNRVARHAVIIADLRRSWLAAAGFWLASFPLRFHAVTRHDGVTSVLRGFTTRELADLVRAATGAEPRVQRRLGFRVTARWQPT